MKKSFFICLISVCAVAVASGQTPTYNPRGTEPLEKYDNSPAYIYRLETSPRMISYRFDGTENRKQKHRGRALALRCAAEIRTLSRPVRVFTRWLFPPYVTDREA